MRKCHGRRPWHRAAGGTGKYAPLVACLLLHDAEAFACPQPGMDAVKSRACLVDQAGTALPCTGVVQQ